ncbi:trypsin-like serine protease [Streptomyces sp. R39]|uniref:Trypsin-like serine protease n=1 Tax=Streptomyces sp. R39 TaxID=3238631 RepID=A0AB39QM08_9ACTN
MRVRKRRLGVILTLLVLALATPSSAWAIQGGSVSKHGPWAVRVYTDGEPSCTGTVVAPEWVITAAHCVRYDNWHITFRVGSLDQRRGTVVKRIKNATVFTPRADVALVKVPRLRVQPIELGRSGDVTVGHRVRAYGWGATCAPPKSESSCQSNLLKQADLKVVAHADRRCELMVGVDDFCSQRGDGLPAGGDSGGPATVKNRAGHEVLVGVLSGSDRTSVASFADVTRLRSWIVSVTRS